MTRVVSTVIGVGAMLAIMAVLWAQTYELEYPADVFPRATFAVATLLGVLILGAELIGRGSRVYDSGAWSSRGFLLDCAITLAATVAYIALFAVIGFYVTTFLFLTGLFMLPHLYREARRMSWPRALILNGGVAFAVTLAVYLCFKTLLKVPAPAGVLF